MSGKNSSKKKKGVTPTPKAAPPIENGKATSSSSDSLKPEERMNLTSLKRRDPYIGQILDTASQVALYLFNEPEDAWEKTEIEGSFFVYRRTAAPFYGFTISNRKVSHVLPQAVG